MQAHNLDLTADLTQNLQRLRVVQAHKLNLEQVLKGETPKVHQSDVEKELAAGTSDYQMHYLLACFLYSVCSLFSV